MATLIQLIRSSMEPIQAARYGVFRIRLEIAAVVTEGESTPRLPLELFLYQRELINAETGQLGDTCLGLCSVPDVAEYPVGEPNVGGTYQFFRKAHAVYDCRSLVDADSLRSLYVDHLLALASAADAAENLSETQITWVPREPS